MIDLLDFILDVWVFVIGFVGLVCWIFIGTVTLPIWILPYGIYKICKR